MRAMIHCTGSLGRAMSRVLNAHLIWITLGIWIRMRVLRGDHASVECRRSCITHRSLRGGCRLLLHVIAWVYRVLIHIVVLLLRWDLLDEHVALIHICRRLLLLLLQTSQCLRRIVVPDVLLLLLQLLLLLVVPPIWVRSRVIVRWHVERAALL